MSSFPLEYTHLSRADWHAGAAGAQLERQSLPAYLHDELPGYAVDAALWNIWQPEVRPVWTGPALHRTRTGRVSRVVPLSACLQPTWSYARPVSLYVVFNT